VTDLRTRKIVIAATEMSTGGLGSYLTNLTEGLTSRNWDIHLVSTNVSGDLFTRMNNFATCHDLSGHPLSKEKIFRAAELINSIAPDITRCRLLKIKPSPSQCCTAMTIGFTKLPLFAGEESFAGLHQLMVLLSDVKRICPRDEERASAPYRTA
jgi:hypothetical protein